MSDSLDQNNPPAPIRPDPQTLPENDEITDNGETSSIAAERYRGNNDYFRAMMDRNFLEYASYVIKDRAIPDVDDGLKPVQRRVLWALYKIYDGRTHKVANVVGNTMHYHPHGNASIEDALVVLANKEYFITRQGNFGNILTGSPAAAGRYIECSLSPLGHEVLFNNDITEFIDTYDGRNIEPVVLPSKVPSLLMLGSDGIAVGMATKIMPHNFNELLEAEIAVLRGEEFKLYPDFQQGGLMDVSEYNDGNGKITLRAKIEIVGRDLIIREIPATTSTETLVASIEKAAEKNKIKISSVNDYTTDKVEIKIVPTRGYDPEKTMRGLYMYTDCAVSLSVNMTVIRENRPVQMSVSEVLRRNASKLLEYMKRELEIDLARQEDMLHAKTLAQIFFENRIYKKIEECKSEKEEYAEVHAGLAPFRHLLRRDVTDQDIDKLIALPVRRISRFDIEKNQRDLAELCAKIEEIKKNLGSLKKYTIKYLQKLLEKYGKFFPRRTEIENFDKIDRRAAALNNIKVGWDRKNGYIGTSIKSDDMFTCNEFDRFLCVNKTGSYKVIALPPEKLFINKLYDFRKYNASTEFGIIYRESESGKYYGKRTSIGGFILDKEYNLCPNGCKLELLTPRADAIYTLLVAGPRNKPQTIELNLMELPVRTPKARGILVASKPIVKITHNRYLTPEELSLFTEKPANDDKITGENLEEVNNLENKNSETSLNQTTETKPQTDSIEQSDSAASSEALKTVTESKDPISQTEDNVTDNITENPSSTPLKAESAKVEEITEDILPIDSTEADAETKPQETIVAKAAIPKKKRATPKPQAEKPSAKEPMVVSPNAPDQDSTEKQKKKTAQESLPPAPSPKEPDQKISVADDDEFGIVQPEFGF